MIVPRPVYELAAVQDDALGEAVIAMIFTDQPVRSALRRGEQQGDTRRHWQWEARRDRQNRGSRVWLSLGETITDDTPDEVKGRVESSLASLLSSGQVTSIEVTVTQIRHDALGLQVRLGRPRLAALELGFVLAQGLPHA